MDDYLGAMGFLPIYEQDITLLSASLPLKAVSQKLISLSQANLLFSHLLQLYSITIHFQ